MLNASTGHPNSPAAVVPTETTAKGDEFRRSGGVLLAATIGSAGSLTSIGYYSLGSFIAPLQAEFGWKRGEVASAFLYTTVVLALISPLMGLMIDRLGVRRMALVSIPALAAVFFALGRFQGSLASFHLLYALAAIAGAGTTPISYTRAVNGAFDKSRGLALGISQAGIALAAIGVPLLMAAAIPYGWRAGYSLLAALTLVPWLFVLVGMRQPASKQAQPVDGPGHTVREALGTVVFWAVGLSFAAIAVAISALVVHLVPLLRDAGVSPMKAAATASFIGVGVLVGRIVGGYLIDRFFAPFVATTLFMLAAGGCLVLLLGGTDMAIVAAGLMGFALGAEADLIAYITARYFGLGRYGVLYSIIYSLFVLGGAIGPTLAGMSFDATGSYNTTLWAVVVVLTCASVAIAKLPRFETFASGKADSRKLPSQPLTP